ncbi:MAG TPA: hypothetical protein VH208_08295, partial [Myxococcaceae bacterium]|nr:hypothetical protein [Myxococcaceae bacterium]
GMSRVIAATLALAVALPVAAWAADGDKDKDKGAKAGAAAPAGDPQEKPEKTLVQGSPPLTDVMLAKYYEFYEWVFDTQLTHEQQRELDEYLVDAWKAKKEREIADALDSLRNHDDVARMSGDERDALRSQVQPQMLKELARDKSPMAKWALSVFANAHKPMAAGKPPLTRQATDAYAEMIAFLISESVGGPAYQPDAAYRDQMAKVATAEWHKLSAADRDALSKVPQAWAAVRVTWPTLPDAEKAKLRKDWLGALSAYKPKDAAAKADGGAPLSEAGRWALDVVGSPKPVDAKVVAKVAGAGWKYEPTHW